MSIVTPSRPAIVLVDNDAHSARLMSRMLVAHGGPAIDWLQDAPAALDALASLNLTEQDGGQLLIVVDLKTSSTATQEFIVALKQRAPRLLVVAMAPSLDRAVRNDLLDAGAGAVFERHGNLDRYRREAASIIAFWVRGQRLNAVGA